MGDSGLSTKDDRRRRRGLAVLALALAPLLTAAPEATMGLKFTSGLNVQAGLEFGQRSTATGGPARAIQLRGSLRW